MKWSIVVREGGVGGMGGDIISESVRVGRESAVGGMSFAVEEGDVLVVVSGIVPNV